MLKFSDVEICPYLENLDAYTIQDQFSQLEYDKGYSYYRSGAVRSPVFYSPNKLEAIVLGQYMPEYKVKIEVVDDQVFNSCTCPIGFSCKHVVALLINWVRDREDFGIKNSNQEKKFKENEYINPDILREILEDHDKDSLFDMLVKTIEVSGLYDDFYFLLDLLNYPPKLKKRILEEYESVKIEIHLEFEILVSNYDELEDYYEEGGGYDNYYGTDPDKFMDKYESDLFEKIEDSIENLKNMSKIIPVLYRYELSKEAGQIYSLFDGYLDLILNSADTSKHYRITHLGDYIDGLPTVLEGPDPNLKIEIEVDDYEWVDLSDLQEFQKTLKEKYQIMTLQKLSRSEKLSRLLHFYLESPSVTIKRSILSLYKVDDLEEMINFLLKEGKQSENLFELMIEILSREKRRNAVVDICKQLLNVPYNHIVYKVLIDSLTEKSLEESIYYCEEAIEKRFKRENYMDYRFCRRVGGLYSELEGEFEKEKFMETLIDLYIKNNQLEDALNLLINYYLKKPVFKTYFKLKNLAIQMDNWEEISNKIITELTKRKKLSNLLDFLRNEERYKESYDLIMGNSFDLGQIIKTAKGCETKKLYIEAINLYKKGIKKLLYSGEGLSSRLSHAVDICLQIKKNYNKLYDIETYKKYISKLESKYKKLWGFRTKFLKHVKLDS